MWGLTLEVTGPFGQSKSGAKVQCQMKPLFSSTTQAQSVGISSVCFMHALRIDPRALLNCSAAPV